MGLGASLRPPEGLFGEGMARVEFLDLWYLSSSNLTTPERQCIVIVPVICVEAVADTAVAQNRFRKLEDVSSEHLLPEI